MAWKRWRKGWKSNPGGGFKDLFFLPLFGEDSHFDYCNIFSTGWFNHQLVILKWLIQIQLNEFSLECLARCSHHGWRLHFIRPKKTQSKWWNIHKALISTMVKRFYKKCISTVYQQSKRAQMSPWKNCSFNYNMGILKSWKTCVFTQLVVSSRETCFKQVTSPVLSRSKRWLKLKMVMGHSACSAFVWEKLITKNFTTPKNSLIRYWYLQFEVPEMFGEPIWKKLVFVKLEVVVFWNSVFFFVRIW